MSRRWTLRVVLFFALFAGCSESVAVTPVPPDAASPDTSVAQPPSPQTVTSVSDEIDLASVDDREMGFVATSDALVARSAHTVTVTGDGVTLSLPRDVGAITLAHAEVSQGGKAVALGAPAISSDAHVVRDGDGVRETIENRHGTFEQRWRFETRVAGDITVRVPVPGATLASEDTRGLHLVVGDARFVYSHARFVDAGGAASDVRATFDDGAIVLVVPRALVALTTFPAVLDPTIGPEIPLFGASHLVRDATSDINASVVMIGTRALAVWANNTTIRCNYADATDTSVTHATRVLAATTNTINRVAVSNGVGVVVISGGTSLSYVRFDASCTPLDTSPRVLMSGSAVTLEHVSPYANGFAVTWSGGGVAYVRAILLDGSVAWTAPTYVSDPEGTLTLPRIVPNTTDLVLVYRRLTSIRAQRISFGGVLDGALPTNLDTGATTTSDTRIGAAHGPSTFALYWRGGSAARTLATFDATTLARLVTAPEASIPVAVGPFAEFPALAYDGAHYGFAFTTVADKRVRIRRLDAATLGIVGTDVLGTSLTAGSESVGGLAEGGGTFVALWSSFVDGDRDPIMLRMDGTEIDPSYVVGLDAWPAVASSGTGFLATWGRMAPEPKVPRGVYVSAAGALTPATGFRLGTTTTIGTTDPYQGDVAASDTHYLTQWSAGSDNGMLFAAGATTGTAAYPFAYATTAVATAEFAGQLRTVLRRQFALDYRVAASPTNEAGTYTAPAGLSYPFAASRNVVAIANTTALTLSITTNPTTTIPVVAAHVSLAHAPTPNEFLLSWATSTGAIGARRVSSTATLVGSAVTLRTGTGTPIDRLASVWDGTRYVVAYVKDGALRAQRVSATGDVVDAVAGTIAPVVTPNLAIDMAADDAGNIMVVYGRDVVMDGFATSRVYARVVDFAVNGPDTNGTACTNGWTCASGICADGVCCDRACGGASASCEACSAASGAAVDGTCGPKLTGTSCRPSAGPCDIAESCTGSDAACPVDVLATGTVCAPAGTGPCDANDVCDGTTAACPARYASAGTSCRAATGPCDVGETCSGLVTTCPFDAVQNSATACRPAAGDCDVAEFCNGSTKTCANDAFRSSAVTCRGAATVCDRAELCTGTSATCPLDSPAIGTMCRFSASVCDAAEFCDGVGFACPPDVFAPTTQVCRASSGVCDAPEFCNGVSGFCPANAPANSGVVCRPATSACDAAEQCNGVATTCPLDGPAARGTVCRPTNGACDIPEVCSGTSRTCPIDGYQDSRFVCRPAAGPCDIAEACSGTDATCLDDQHLVDGTSCDDGLICNGDATCDEGICQEAQPLMCEADEVCSERADGCLPEASDGCTVTHGASTRGGPDASALAFVLLGLVVVRRRRR